jgi:hypothetical protein
MVKGYKMKHFAVIDEMGVVINVIVADDDFVKNYTNETGYTCIEYDETCTDEDNIARIGEIYKDGKFIQNTVDNIKYINVNEPEQMSQTIHTNDIQHVQDQASIASDIYEYKRKIFSSPVFENEDTFEIAKLIRDSDDINEINMYMSILSMAKVLNLSTEEVGIKLQEMMKVEVE